MQQALRAIMEELLPQVGGTEKASSPGVPTLVVGVSGGVDSMVLITVLAQLRVQLGVGLHAAHVDHALRGTSARDAAFVQSACEAMGVPITSMRLGPVPEKENIEEWCRRQRYRFFEEVRSTTTGHAILTAHHADDALETFLIRLLANKEPRTIARIDGDRRVLRPLLAFRREEIERFAREEGIKFVEDETNAQTSFVRNRVRHLLLPFISKEFGKEAVTSLLDRARFAADDEELLSLWACSCLKEVGTRDFGSREWVQSLRRAIQEAPEGLAWRLVELAFKEKLPYRLGRLKALELCQVVRNEIVAVQLPGGIEIRRSEGAISLSSVR